MKKLVIKIALSLILTLLCVDLVIVGLSITGHEEAAKAISDKLLDYIS